MSQAREIQVAQGYVTLPNTQADMLRPTSSELPSAWAARLSDWVSDTTDRGYRKKIGQFFTPLEVARFMAKLATPRPRLRILEPGCGTGVLSCALIESICDSGLAKEIELVAYDRDPRMVHVANFTLRRVQRLCRLKQVSMAYKVYEQDFTERANARQNGLSNNTDIQDDLFDIVICNPPYLALKKNGSYANTANSIGAGTSNTYALFMMLSAYMLSEKGQLIFITPRSFCSGQYFARFRTEFFRIMRPAHLHIFDSRSDAFSKDSVLQENIVLKAIREGRSNSLSSVQTVTVSSSDGKRDILQLKSRGVPLDVVVDTRSPIMPLRIPATQEDEKIVEIVDAWPRRIGNIGLHVSTGPVVAYRASKYLHNHEDISASSRLAPLLWGHHVTPMSVRWPIENGRNKPQAISIEAEKERMLVRTATYVLVRRFSAKEDAARLIAAVMTSEMFARYKHIGLENHLNYIYRTSSELSIDEATGIALLLNSSLMDRYFRILNGNTQVSASELKSFPLPSHESVVSLGKAWLEAESKQKPCVIDRLLTEILGVPLNGTLIPNGGKDARLR